MGELVPIRKRGQLTLPASARKKFNIDEGDVMEAEMTSEGILLKPKKLIDASQTWFWSKEWQAGEKEAEYDIKKGRVKKYEDVDELIDNLSKE